MASQPHTILPRAKKYRYKWHSAIFLAIMFAIAMFAFTASIVSSRAASTPLLDDATMSAAREVASTKLPERVPLAQAEGLQLMLPVYGREVTAIGFHPSADDDAVPLDPIGQQVNGSVIASSLGQVFPQDGTKYVVMSGSGDADIKAMDVGAPAGTNVFAPVDGVVTGIKAYQEEGQCPDIEINIQPQSQPRLTVALSHLDYPQVSLGQPVRTGTTRIGSVRAMDGCLNQSLRQYTYDNGNHLQMQVDLVK